MSTNLNENYGALPKLWIKQLFKIPTSNENENKKYFNDFFSFTLNILDCKLKVPRQTQWRGHPFYYEALKMFEMVCQKSPTSLEHILSIPIWYNVSLNTQFDVELSRAGFNFVKDLFPSTQLICLDDPIVTTLRIPKRRALVRIILNIPEFWGNLITESPDS